MYPYEGMFFVDPVLHAADPEGIEKKVSGLLEKHGAKIHHLERWDDRKLAYEIKGHKRGIYVLARFEMPGAGLNAMRREARIVECILRQLVVRLEDDIPTYLQKCAAYYDRMREDQEARRPRRDSGEEEYDLGPDLSVEVDES